MAEPRTQAEGRQPGVDGLRVVETSPYLGFVRRIIVAAGRRVGEGDIEALAELVAVRDNLEEAIAVAVQGLRTFGYSWSDIGRVVGTTKQAAQQRYGKPE